MENKIDGAMKDVSAKVIDPYQANEEENNHVLENITQSINKLSAQKVTSLLSNINFLEKFRSLGENFKENTFLKTIVNKLSADQLQLIFTENLNVILQPYAKSLNLKNIDNVASLLRMNWHLTTDRILPIAFNEILPKDKAERINFINSLLLLSSELIIKTNLFEHIIAFFGGRSKESELLKACLRQEVKKTSCKYHDRKTIKSLLKYDLCKIEDLLVFDSKDTENDKVGKLVEIIMSLDPQKNNEIEYAKINKKLQSLDGLQFFEKLGGIHNGYYYCDEVKSFTHWVVSQEYKEVKHLLRHLYLYSKKTNVKILSNVEILSRSDFAKLTETEVHYNKIYDDISFYIGSFSMSNFGKDTKTLIDNVTEDITSFKLLQLIKDTKGNEEFNGCHAYIITLLAKSKSEKSQQQLIQIINEFNDDQFYKIITDQRDDQHKFYCLQSLLSTENVLSVVISKLTSDHVKQLLVNSNLLGKLLNQNYNSGINKLKDIFKKLKADHLCTLIANNKIIKTFMQYSTRLGFEVFPLIVNKLNNDDKLVSIISSTNLIDTLAKKDTKAAKNMLNCIIDKITNKKIQSLITKNMSPIIQCRLSDIDLKDVDNLKSIINLNEKIEIILQSPFEFKKFMLSEDARKFGIANIKSLISLPSDRFIELKLLKNIVFFFGADSKESELVKKNYGNKLKKSVNEHTDADIIASLLVLGVCKIEELLNFKKADMILVVLIAASYSGSNFSANEFFESLDMICQKGFRINKIHLNMVENIKNTKIKNAIVKQYDYQNQNKKLKESLAIKFQGGFRAKRYLYPSDRTYSLTPTFFKTSKSTLFATGSDVPQHISINDFHQYTVLKNSVDLFNMMREHMATHCIKHKETNSVFVSFPKTTTHYVLSKGAFNHVVNYKRLLSYDARNSKIDDYDFTSRGRMTAMVKSDLDSGDGAHICTAAIETSFDNGFQSGKYCLKITYGLRRVPESYLCNAIVKLGDFHEMRQNTVDIIPGIEIFIDVNRIDRSCQISFIERATGEKVKLESPVRAVFYGFDGLKTVVSFIFYLVASIPETKPGLVIKNKIINYFKDTYKENPKKFFQKIDTITKDIFKKMEIDFLHGLPFSFHYMSSIEFSTNSRKIQSFDLEKLRNSLENGDLAAAKLFIDTVIKLNLEKPMLLMRELINITPPHCYTAVLSLIENVLAPRDYLILKKGIDLKTSGHFGEIKLSVAESCLEDTLPVEYNYDALLKEIERHLKNNKELCKKLKKQYQSEISSFVAKLKRFCNNTEQVGLDSKIRELFSNPDLMNMILVDNGEMIAAILAHEILSKKDSNEIVVKKHISQRDKSEIDVTPSSLLFSGLKISTFSMDALPLNNHGKRINVNVLDKPKVAERISLIDYIEQKELNVELRHQLYDVIIQWSEKHLDSSILKAHQLKANNQMTQYDLWLKYYDTIEESCRIIKDNYEQFCKRQKIVNEVNLYFPQYIQTIIPKHHNGSSKLNGNVIEISNVTKSELVELFLQSSTILQASPYAHFIFDKLHFAVAMTNDGIYQLKFDDGTHISFTKLIDMSIKQLSKPNNINTGNAIMAQQLALRGMLLREWCEEKALNKTYTLNNK